MMTFTARIVNSEGTRSTAMNQQQLNVAVDVLNERHPKSKVNAVLLQRLAAAGLAPDFYATTRIRRI